MLLLIHAMTSPEKQLTAHACYGPSFYARTTDVCDLIAVILAMTLEAPQLRAAGVRSVQGSEDVVCDMLRSVRVLACRAPPDVAHHVVII